MNPADSAQRTSIARDVLWGAVAFMLTSVIAFGVWAFGGGWFRGRGGEPAMYAVITVVFVGLAGLLLHPLMRGPRRVARFYAVFTPAFVAYAVVWSGFWFWLGGGAGEWLGALLGSGVFVALTAWRLGQWRGFWPAAAMFFVLHTAGYFAGGWSMGELMGVARSDDPGAWTRSQWMTAAKLSWGFFYGLGFGAGLGLACYLLQRPGPSESR